MQINVSQQLRASVGTVRSYRVSEVIDIVGDSGSRVKGEVSLVRTNQGILAKARLHAEVELACSRCLSLFSCPVAVDFEEEYFPSTDIVSGDLLLSSDESGSLTIDEHHVLDLTEGIRQYGLLAIPMKPLCHEGCAGLCPVGERNLS